MSENSSPVRPFASGFSRAQWLTIALVVSAVLDAIGICSSWLQIDLLSKVAAGWNISKAEATANDNREALIGLLQVGVYLVTVVLFLMWIYRAHQNLPALGARNLQFTLAWAVGWFFVPVLSLIRPYQVVKEIWMASHPTDEVTAAIARRPVKLPWVLGWWWAAWTVSNLLGWAAFRASNADTLQGYTAATWINLIGGIAGIIAALGAITVIRLIDERQEATAYEISSLNTVAAYPPAEMVRY